MRFHPVAVRFLLAPLLYAMLAPLIVLGAQPAPATAEAWRRFAERVSPGALVVVSLKSGERLEGRVVQVSVEGLYLSPKTRIPVPVRVLPFDDVQSIEIQKQRMSPGAKTLMWTGIGTGALLLFLGILVAALGD